MTLKPERRASSPIIAPPRKAVAGFQVAAVAMPDGQRGALALLLRAALGRDADAGVGLPLRRDAEPRNAGNVAGRALAPRPPAR